MRVFNIESIEMLGIAVVVLFIGVFLTQRIAFLKNNFIPPAVTGGLLTAVLTWVLYDGFDIAFEFGSFIIDHHVSQDDLGATPYKNTTAEATGRLIAELAEQVDVALTPEIATPLFAALVTDTGWLRFPSVTSSSYEVAARLRGIATLFLNSSIALAAHEFRYVILDEAQYIKNPRAKVTQAVTRLRADSQGRGRRRERRGTS